MEVIRETLWKRCKPPAKYSNICLSETAYQHKGTRKKCKKTNQAAIIQWQRQCLMDKPHRKPWPKSKISLSRVPVHCITPFCSDALVSPPNLYPPCKYLFKRACDHRIQLFQKTLSEEKQKAFMPRPKGNMGVLEWLAIGPCRGLAATHVCPWDEFGTSFCKWDYF